MPCVGDGQAARDRHTYPITKGRVVQFVPPSVVVKIV